MAEKKTAVKSPGINISLLLSILLHVLILLIISLSLPKNPFTTPSKPMNVEIQTSSSQIAEGISDSLEKNPPKKQMEETERITEQTEPTESSSVPETAEPVKEPLPETDIEENITEPAKTEKNIQEPAAQPVPEPVIPIQEDKQKEIEKDVEEYLQEEEETVTEEEQKQPEETEKNTEPVKETASKASENQEKQTNRNNEEPVVAADIPEEKEEKNEAKQKRETEPDEIDKELLAISEGLDDILDEPLGQEGESEEQTSTDQSDPLYGAEWSSRPRKTLHYPDLQTALDRAGIKAMSYDLTARITFDQNGIAVNVEIIRSSGSSEVDRIFNQELKKIRVESIPVNRKDTITKKFSISVR